MDLNKFLQQNSELNEEWKDIPNFEEFYMISNYGRIISKERYVNNGHQNIYKPIKFLKVNIYDNRKFITLSKDGKDKKFSLSKLIADVFIPKPSEDCILKFKDNNSLNCTINNLVWIKKIDRHTKFNIENLIDEVWKDIPGYEGYYAASNKGRIKSLSRDVYTNNKIIHTQDRIMNQTTNVGGYFYVTLSKNGSYKKCLVHRLVALTFIENPNNYPHIDHIDTNIKNNCSNNLRWVTPSLNMQNQLTKQHISEGLKGKKNKSWNCTPIVQLKDNKLINIYPSIAEAARNNFGYTGIQKCLAGRQRTHKGFKWMYKVDYDKLSPE